MRLLVEFDSKQAMLYLHGSHSLSSLVTPIENLGGIVLVTQPNINELEVYLDRNFFSVNGVGNLRSQLSLLARDNRFQLEYVNN